MDNSTASQGCTEIRVGALVYSPTLRLAPVEALLIEVSCPV